MKYGLRAALASIPMLLMFTVTECALADGTVNVTREGDNLSGMRMTATPGSVKAGRVTIHAINKSRALVHESIVVWLRNRKLNTNQTDCYHYQSFNDTES